MDIYTSAFELIDMRSFSSLWFWILLAVIWSSISHFVIGIPFDMVTRAGSDQPGAARDLVDMARLHSVRLQLLTTGGGLWLVAAAAFVLSILAVLGFGYGLELCQALFLIAGPLTVVFILSVRMAWRLRLDDVAQLRRQLRWHRVMVQGIGLMSILITSMWGMYINMTAGALNW